MFGIPPIIKLDMVQADFPEAVRQPFDHVKNILDVKPGEYPAVIVFELENGDPSRFELRKCADHHLHIMPLCITFQ